MSDNFIIWLGLLTLGVGVGLIILLVVAAKVLRAFREIRGDAEAREIRPQPFVVKQETEFATKKEMDGVKKDIAAVDVDLKTLRKEIVENGERRRISIEGKVNDAACESRQMNTALRREMKADIDAVQDRINAVLTAVAELKGKVEAV